MKMNDVNYNDNTRIIIQKDYFENIILDINNNDNKYTFMNLNDYILFLKIFSDKKDKELFEKVKDIKKEYINEKLRFDKEDYYKDLKKINLKRYKAIKYYADRKNQIISYCNNRKDEYNNFNINLLICKLKYEFINIELENNIEYDIINNILNNININESLIMETQYKKEICIEYFNKNYKNNNKENIKNNIKKASLILGGVVGLTGLTILSIPTIFGISVLGPVAGGLFASLQSMGITLSIIQSISMTGATLTIGTCTLSGATMIILPGLLITDKDIINDKKLKNEIEKYFIYININKYIKDIINNYLNYNIIHNIIEKQKIKFPI